MVCDRRGLRPSKMAERSLDNQGYLILYCFSITWMIEKEIGEV